MQICLLLQYSEQNRVRPNSSYFNILHYCWFKNLQTSSNEREPDDVSKLKLFMSCHLLYVQDTAA